MRTRLRYGLPIAREFARTARDRALRGGLRSRMSHAGGRPFVIVTGAGRSGTSAVARVLHESGVLMGEHFAEASKANPDGFYEELPVCDLNDRIMKECGMQTLDRWPARSTIRAVGAQYGGTMRELSASERVAGWKDPRLSVTLEAWLPHFADPPKVVVCLRSPEAFVRSVTRTYGVVPRDAIERRWANLYRRLLDVIRDYRLDATCVEYERLVREPPPAVQALAAFVGRDLDASFVEPAHRNYAHAVPAKFVPLYRRVAALANRPGEQNEPLALQPLDQPASIDGYVRALRDIERAVTVAHDQWSARVASPEGGLALEAGADPAVIDEARAASESYEPVLADAQVNIGELAPPSTLEPLHDLTLTWIDRERLVARLLLQATEGPSLNSDRLAEAIEAWRRFSSPAAARAARQRREEALERYLHGVG